MLRKKLSVRSLLPAKPSPRLSGPCAFGGYGDLVENSVGPTPARLDRRSEFVEVNWLDEIGVCPQASRLEFNVRIATSRQEYKSHSAPERRAHVQPPQYLEAGHSRHPDITQHQIGRFPLDGAEALLAAARQNDAESAILQFFPEQGREFLIVFDTQNLCRALVHSRRAQLPIAQIAAAATG